MHPLLLDEPGRQELLLGNEAIVRGALEAGVTLAAAYPGTPSSEIIDTFADLGRESGVYHEYSTNEKVALEMGIGCSYSYGRALVSMKHVGLNVALEPFAAVSYTGVRGGLVVVSADDPGCHSSQDEQDNRYLSRLAKVPTLEPSTAQEALELTRLAFDLSERFETPVLLRTTTRVNHMRGVVTYGRRPAPVKPRGFVKDPMRLMGVPALARVHHVELLERMARFAAEVEGDAYARESGGGRLGILSCGISRCYVHDAVEELGLHDRIRHLELLVTHPVPQARLRAFLGRVDRVLVVEELEPILENELRELIARERLGVEVLGKSSGHFPVKGEFDPDLVRAGVLRYLGGEVPAAAAAADAGKDLPVPPRPPTLCAGCPHRATYYAIKLQTRNEAIYASDIGCYTLALQAPIKMADTMLCMGASTAIAGGLAFSNDRPVVAFIGDSTFFHAGMTGLINAISNGHRYMLVILDNGTTAMTGHQPHPSSAGTHRGRPVALEPAVRGLGVEKVEVVDPMDLRETQRAVRECLAFDGVSVLISRHLCPLYEGRLRKGKEKVVYRVDAAACSHCGFKGEGMHCGVATCPSTTLWRSRRRVDVLDPTTLEAPAKMAVPPCAATCPLNICVHGYVAHVAAGQYGEAMATIRARNPLPSICGRVCHHPCETACIRADYDEPVAINRLKRFASEWEAAHPEAAPPVAPPALRRPEKVAVVGSGPAGLGCAHDLAQRGYAVTVFDARSEPGGLLRWGIPEHRLPRQVLARDIDRLRAQGITFRCDTPVGPGLTPADLRAQGYAAVFLAVGAGTGLHLGIENETAPGVTDAVAFLDAVNRGERPALAEPVVVVGGGNAAVDAARVALRLGARQVTLAYRRTRAEMPAIAEEVEAAQAEGVSLEFLAAPARVELRDGRVAALRCLRMELGEPGPDGRRRPVPVPGGEFDLPAGAIIVAIGQRLDPAALAAGDLGSPEHPWIAADPDTGMTREPGIFAGGDAVTGPYTVVHAIAAGRRAAHAIDRWIRGAGEAVEPLPFYPPERLDGQTRYRPDAVVRTPREEIPHLPAQTARAGFVEVEGTLDEAAARREADRCLACGSCANCNTCLDHFACVALYREDGKVKVNEALCNGCGVCAQLCPNHAFVKVVL